MMDSERALQEKISERYWLHKLRGANSDPFIPSYIRCAVGKSEEIFFSDADLVRALNKTGRSNPSAKFAIMVAVLRILYFRYSHSGDLLIAMPAGREGEAGGYHFFRGQITGAEAVRDLVKATARELEENRDHGGVDWPGLSERLGAAGHGAPILRLGISYNYYTSDDPDEGPVPVCFHLQESDFFIRLTITHAVEEDYAYFIKQAGEHYFHLLQQVLENPGQVISGLELLTPGERVRILEDFNATGREYDPALTVSLLLEEQVNRSPGTTAVVFEEQEYSYADLNRAVNRLANWLIRERATGVGENIGVCLPRSMESVMTMLAIIKTGACYVPLDDKLPDQRLQYLIDDSAPVLIFTIAAIRDRISGKVNGNFICIEEIETGDDETNPVVDIAGDDLSYIIYTSGSTGMPKGVMQTHRMLANLVSWDNDHSGLPGGLRLLQYASFSFDASLHDIYFSLSNGGTVYLLNDEQRLDFPGLARYVVKNEIGIFSVPYAVLSGFFSAFDLSMLSGHRISHIISTGEQLLIGAGLEAFLLKYPEVRLHNFYGPSETHVVTASDLTGAYIGGKRVPIGKPIANSTIYILDAFYQPVPIGIAGEIYIGGYNLARGYLNNEPLTREKFVSPLVGNQQILYRSGDIGRWLPDGTIEYIGRIDHQVKIRGFRVEPGETEKVLLRSPAVRDAIVVTRRLPDEMVLVAYLIPAVSGGADINGIKTYLSEYLPDYMIPLHYVFMDGFPLTGNGKVDKTALPDPLLRREKANEEGYTAPRNELEEQLAGIWQQVFGKNKIGINDSFFDMGGHSLKAIRLAAVVFRDLGLEIRLRDIFLYPTIAGLAKRIGHTAPNGKGMIMPQPEQEYYDTSHAQRRLWILHQMAGEAAAAYNILSLFRIRGHIAPEIFISCVRELVSRHESLRTCFVEVDGEPKQKIIPVPDLSFSPVFIDYSGDEYALEAIRSIAAEEAVKIFDLRRGPLMEIKLIKTKEDEYCCLINQHHIITDARSIDIFVRELSLLYVSMAGGDPAILSPLRIQYKDFAAWQNRQLDGASMEEHRSYWLGRFRDAVPLLNLPLDHARPAIKTYNGDRVFSHTGLDVLKKIQAINYTKRATSFMTVLTAVKVLLYRYTGATDIVAGTPIEGRDADLEDQVGFFVNTVALRSRIDGKKSFGQLLEDIKEVVLGAFEHQAYPFDKLVEELYMPRYPDRSPLFDVVVSYRHEDVFGQRMPVGKRLEIEVLEYDYVISKFDLSFHFSEMENDLTLQIEYNKDLFNRTRILRMAEHFNNLLRGMLDRPELPVSDLALLSGEEQERIFSFSAGKPGLPQDAGRDISSSLTLSSLFAAQVMATPGNMAIRCGEVMLTYAELDARSNRLAAYLRTRLQVPAGAVVAVIMEKSADIVVAILGIVKAGYAYVPVDIRNPVQRIRMLMKDVAPVLAICDHAMAGIFDGATFPFLSMEGGFMAGDVATDAVTCPEVNGHTLAYIIYTSGSTGKPKGVMVEHRSIINLVKDTDYIHIGPGDRILQTGALSFDASTFEIWGALLNGATLYLAPTEDLMKPQFLRELVAAEDISVAWFTSSWFNQLVETDMTIFAPLKTLLVGGEKLSARHVRKIRAAYPDLTLINGYGPTENTTFSTCYAIPSAVAENIPIGRPVSGNEVWVLDESGGLVPIGYEGEIVVGGMGLSRGYLNQPALTAGKFIAHPYVKGRLLYRTGDTGRWLEDGVLEYMGRLDEQVKIRGNRIEPGEIEAVLSGCPLVSGCVVVAREDVHGDLQLVGYIRPAGIFCREEIFAYLKEQLPDHMMPWVLVELEELPLTPNGKVDKGALPAPDTGGGVAGGHQTARNEQERQLVKIWEELLKVDGIGVTDNFFALGGHSLMATRVISMIRKELGMELAMKDIFIHPTIAGLSVLLSARERSSMQAPDMVPVPVERSAQLPPSFAQERLWMIDKIQGSVAYHIPVVLRLEGRLDIGRLIKAFRQIIDRHEILRTVLAEEDGRLVQVIRERVDWQPEYDEDEEAVEDEREIVKMVTSFIARPFDLSRDDMIRVKLIKRSAGALEVIIVMHHIASDGWSLSVMMEEFIRNYAVREGKDPLSPLVMQYADYALWQRRYLAGAVFEKQMDYWREQLRDIQPLALQTDHIRPRVQSTKGGNVVGRIDRALTRSLKSLSDRERVTLFMTMLSAFKVLLYRYTGQADICVGSPIANRTQKFMEPMIGFFVNTLALRSDLSGRPTFRAVLQNVKRMTLDAYENQDMPFEKIVDEVVRERDLGRTPLFQVMFVLLNTPEVPEWNDPDMRLSVLETGTGTSKFDLTFNVQEAGEELMLGVEYCSDLLEKATVERMCGHYIRLLREVVLDAGREIDALQMLEEVEKKELLVNYNNSDKAYDLDRTIVDLFEEQAARVAGNVAVVYEGEQLSYAALDELSDRFAFYLRDLGVHDNVLVPICLDRSPNMIIGILGILKAGGAYVPVDPSYPVERVAYILSDTEARVVVTDNYDHDGVIYAKPGVIRVNMSEAVWAGGYLRSGNDSGWERPKHGDLAYVIYTSGSTGVPKGVMVGHRGLTNRLCWMQDYFDLREDDRILQKTSYCFDVSVWELLWPLIRGASLVFARPGGHKDPAYLERAIAEQGITTIHFVPSMLEIFLQQVSLPREACRSLRRVLCSGEALKVSQALQFREALGDLPLYNLYGPTEATIDVSCRLVERGDLERMSIPIGGPVANTRLYVLDAWGNVVPAGVPGELYIGGVQVARGYLNKDELTAARFLADRMGTAEGGRLYRTGDIVRWLDGGVLEYIGRQDDQVKIRGYRIEPGEIEAVLGSCPLVSQCVVVARSTVQGERQLVGYIVPAATLQKEAILSYLKERLPDYMIPWILVALPVLPLTSSGKVDKKALPAPDVSAWTGNSYQAPGNMQEAQLSEIWQELLHVERVGIRDNFFQLGGDSLTAIRLTALIRKRIGKELAIRSVFEYPTIAGISGQLKDHSGPPIVRDREAEGWGRLSYSQERLWFIDKLQGSGQYHMPWVFRLRGQPDMEALEGAFKEIVRRHEVLRTVIREVDGVAYQEILPADDWHLQRVGVEDISGLAEEYAARWLEESFDLSRDFALRVNLVAVSPEEYLLLALVHHIAFDGWSIGILVGELAELYESRINNRVAALSALPVQYADYAHWQRLYQSDEKLAVKLDYWKGQLKDVTPLLLQTDHPRSAGRSIRGGLASMVIGRETLDGLHRLGGSKGATLFMVLLSAFKVLLYRHTGQQDICVGTPISGRTQEELEGLIGFFINTLALRSQVSGDLAFAALLERVKATALDAYANQEVPFEKIVDVVGVERDTSRNAIFQVMLALQNVPQNENVQLGGLQLSAEMPVVRTSLFDISLDAVETGGELLLSLTYNSDLYMKETADRLLAHYGNILRAVVTDASMPVGRLPMLTTEEEWQVRDGFNDTAMSWPGDKTLIDLLGGQVRRDPGATALVYRALDSHEECMTYGELDERSNQLAHYLLEQGLGREERVGICLERGMEMIVAILGILKAGGAYVPLDPGYAEERLQYMIEDSGSRLVLTTRELARVLPAVTRAIYLERGLSSIRSFPVSPVKAASLPEDLAYVIYTSGSMGQPKGVLVGQGAVVNMILDRSRVFSISRDDRILQFSNYCFDASVEQIFLALLNGAVLVLVPAALFSDQRAFEEMLFTQRVTHLDATPSFIEMLTPGRYGGLRRLVSGGEACGGMLAERWQGLVDFYNEYGPTETTVVVLGWKVQAREGAIPDRLPVGRPLANTRAYILDSEGQLSGIGVPGELCIGGVQVARGYLNLPELTTAQFIPDPFSAAPGARLYRTGDRAQWLPDGNIDFLGRLDDQVKLRGFRIEPGEVEQVLNRAPGVRQAVALVYKKERNERLVAFVASDGVFDRAAIQSWLRSRLPDHMLPSMLVEIDHIPLTAHGKTDKRRLLMQVADEERRTSADMEPGSPVEAELVRIWQDLLGVQRVGVHDNFFELGGHSIIMVRVLSRMRESGIDVGLHELFQFQTISEQARLIEGQPAKANAGPYGIAQVRNRHLLTFHEQGEGLPIIILPGSMGLVDGYDELAEAFRGICPVYGIQMQGVYDGEKALGSVGEIAALNNRWIKERWPSGPYRFIGHSFGGHVAFEMCRQLEKKGEKIQWAALLDVPSVLNKILVTDDNKVAIVMHAAAEVFKANKVALKDRENWTASLEQALAGLDIRKMVPYLRSSIGQLTGWTDANLEFSLNVLDVSITNMLIGSVAREKIDAPLLIVKAAEGGLAEGGSANGIRSMGDESLGWSSHTADIQVATIPGDHFSMIKGAGAMVLAELIKQKDPELK